MFINKVYLLQETILFPGEVDFDPELWNHNATQLWTDGKRNSLFV